MLNTSDADQNVAIGFSFAEKRVFHSVRIHTYKFVNNDAKVSDLSQTIVTYID
jgi:hypothetical protein